MKAEIHSLFGVSAPTGEPVEDVIKVLEALLACAKAGEVSAVAVTWIAPNRNVYDDWACGVLPTMALLTATDRLHHRLHKAMDE